jgi:UDP-3-O-[3-hydroxymyristoyl] glucosamine N-acyltransferase
MKITAIKLAELVGGELNGSPELVVTGAAGLDEAGPSDVSFLANPKYADKLAETRAGLLFITEKTPVSGKSTIKVKNPQLAFAKVLELIAPEINPPEKPGIHPTAVVSKNARIGKDVFVGPFAVIEDGASVGSGTAIRAHCFIGRKSTIGSSSLIYPNVTIRENVAIGDRAVIHSGTVIGSDGFGFVAEGKSHHKIPQLGGVEIGNDVEIGANCTIDRATFDKTRIGDGTKFDNLVHIAHNVQIGRNCLIAGQTGIAGSVKIGDNVVFGGQSGSTGHVTIGNNAIIAGRGAVINDIPEGQIVSGYPARPHREAMKIEAIIHKLPELYERLKKLKGADKERQK